MAALAVPGPVTNTVAVVSAEQPIGVEAQDTTEIVGQADLALTKTDGVSVVAAGDGVTYTYTLTVRDDGPSDATGVVLTDTWPAGFSQGAVTPSQGTCAPIGAGPDLTCALGTIAAGASATVGIDYTVPAATPGGPQVNTATVGGSLVDPDPSDDTASDTTMVTAAPPPTPVPGGGAAPDTSALEDLPSVLGEIDPIAAPFALLIGLAFVLFSASAWELRRRRRPDEGLTGPEL